MSAAERRHRRNTQKHEAAQGRNLASPQAVSIAILVPPGILPWERELLLPHIEALLSAVLEDLAANGDED